MLNVIFWFQIYVLARVSADTLNGTCDTITSFKTSSTSSTTDCLVLFENKTCFVDNGVPEIYSTCENSSSPLIKIGSKTGRLFQIANKRQLQGSTSFQLFLEGINNFSIQHYSQVTCLSNQVNTVSSTFPYGRTLFFSSSSVVWIFIDSSPICGEFKFNMTNDRPPLRNHFIWKDETMIPIIVSGVIFGFLLLFSLVRADDPFVWLILDAAVILSIMSIVIGIILGSKDDGDPGLPYADTFLFPMAGFLIPFTVTFAFVLFWKKMMSVLMVYDVKNEQIVPLRGFGRKKIAIISWRWDIDDAAQFQESKILKRCFQRAKDLEIDYVAVDVITLDQKSVDPRSVLHFTESYSRTPVIVGVQTQQELDIYKSRFWTNVEMTNYRNNPKVFTLDQNLLTPWSQFRNIYEIVDSNQVAATYDLDRLQVLLFNVPFAMLFMGRPLRIIRRLEHKKFDIKLTELEPCFAIANATRSLMYASFRDMDCCEGNGCCSAIGKSFIAFCWVWLVALPSIPICTRRNPLFLPVLMYWMIFIGLFIAAMASIPTRNSLTIIVLLGVSGIFVVFGKSCVVFWASRQISMKLLRLAQPNSNAQKTAVVVAGDI